MSTEDQLMLSRLHTHLEARPAPLMLVFYDRPEDRHSRLSDFVCLQNGYANGALMDGELFSVTEESLSILPFSVN